MGGNKYSFPVILKSGMKASYNLSPAHKGRLKDAIDFIVAVNTPIFAAARGVVVDVKDDSDISGNQKDYDKYGNYIEVKHDNDEYTIYEHIKKKGSLVKVGDNISEGDLIGYTGDTGWISNLGPHLHFDVHKYYGVGAEDYETIPIIWRDTKKLNQYLINSQILGT